VIPERVGPDPLREVFGERLYGAAAELAAGGSVTDVRVLQGGGVVTGVVGNIAFIFAAPVLAAAVGRSRVSATVASAVPASMLQR
jgi:hypothetical protein